MHKLKTYPIHPSHPERVCWGCQRLCPATRMACGNGKDRTEHPSELFGDDWYDAPVLAFASRSSVPPPR